MHTDMRSKAKERETVVEVGKLRSEPVDKTKKSGSISVERRGSPRNCSHRVIVSSEIPVSRGRPIH